MKKLLLIVLLALGVGAGVFFVDNSPRVPLAVQLDEATNRPEGRLMLTLRVTNKTSCAYLFSYDAEMLSEPGRKVDYSTVSFLDAHAVQNHTLILPSSAAARVTVDCGRAPNALQNKLNEWLNDCGLPQYFGDRHGRCFSLDWADSGAR